MSSPSHITPISLYTEIYVAKQQRGDILLGYIVPNGTTKAELQRIASANKWAGSDKLSSIYQNELLEGYEISKAVRRTYWGGGNVVWDIKDPRGFHFEISSNNMFKLLESATIVEGKIQGRCILGKIGSQHLLLPENSEPYKEAIKFREFINKPNIKKSDIKPGYIIQLKSQSIVEYIGTFHYVTLKTFLSDRDRKFTFGVSTSPKHLLRSVNGYIYSMLESSLEIAEIISSNEKIYDMENVNKLLREINGRTVYDNLKERTMWYDINEPLFALNKKPKSISISKKSRNKVSLETSYTKGECLIGDIITITVDNNIVCEHVWGQSGYTVNYGT